MKILRKILNPRYASTSFPFWYELKYLWLFLSSTIDFGIACQMFFCVIVVSVSNSLLLLAPLYLKRATLIAQSQLGSQMTIKMAVVFFAYGIIKFLASIFNDIAAYLVSGIIPYFQQKFVEVGFFTRRTNIAISLGSRLLSGQLGLGSVLYNGIFFLIPNLCSLFFALFFFMTRGSALTISIAVGFFAFYIFVLKIKYQKIESLKRKFLKANFKLIQYVDENEMLPAENEFFLVLNQQKTFFEGLLFQKIAEARISVNVLAYLFVSVFAFIFFSDFYYGRIDSQTLTLALMGCSGVASSFVMLSKNLQFIVKNLLWIGALRK